MVMIYFDYVKENIIKYSLGKIKTLDECVETKKLLEKEKKAYNPYIELSENFLKYEKGETEDSGDWYFYKYLKSLGKENVYVFPLEDGNYVIAKVDLFKPYDSLTNLLNPQWHLLVANYAYIDAAFNHNDDIYVSKIRKKNKWIKNKRVLKFFTNKVLSEWMKEAIIEP